MSAGIKNRVVRALHAFYEVDLEEALFQIAPAIDATAQKRYPGKKPGVRVRTFLKDEQDLIYGFSTQNRILVSQSAAIAFGNDGEFQSIVYKFVRCAQSHDCCLGHKQSDNRRRLRHWKVHHPRCVAYTATGNNIDITRHHICAYFFGGVRH